MPTPAPHKQPHQTQWEKVKLGDIAEIDPKEKIKKGVKAKKISMGDIIPFYKFAKFSSFENFKSGWKNLEMAIYYWQKLLLALKMAKQLLSIV